MTEDLHIKYRPESLDQMVGQQHVVKSLESLQKEDKLPHCFLFSGEPGVGKTSLARIIGKMVNCASQNIIEIDGANYSGVDALRELCSGLRYSGMGKNKNRLVIINECQRISSAAFDVLLMPMEDTPEHLYFALSTTNIKKVPKEIQTRCHKYNLKDVSMFDLTELLDLVSEEEGLGFSEGWLEMIAEKSNGSPRQALVYLSMCRGCTTIQDAKLILESSLENAQVIDLCRLLIKDKPSWAKAQELLKDLKTIDPESIRIQICGWLNACILKNEGNTSLYFLTILEKFSEPFYDQTGYSKLLLSVGDVVFGGED